MADDNLERVRWLWDEYRYRHELCWNLLFKITLVTATISITPYLNKEIIGEAGRLVYFTPPIGILLALVGGIWLIKEALLLGIIRSEYRERQKQVLNKNLHKENKSSFTAFIIIYMTLLTGLAILNFKMLITLGL